MKRKLITTIFMVLSLGALSAAAQDYQAPQVKISQDKVRVNGKSYYAHVVTEKQTLYSISKAYNVSLQDIYDANKNLDLENAGLKAGQVIFIPTQPSAPAETAPSAPATAVPSPVQETPAKTHETPKPRESSALDRWLYPGKFKTNKAEEQPSAPAETEADVIETTALPVPVGFMKSRLVHIILNASVNMPLELGSYSTRDSFPPLFLRFFLSGISARNGTEIVSSISFLVWTLVSRNNLRRRMIAGIRIPIKKARIIIFSLLGETGTEDPSAVSIILALLSTIACVKAFSSRLLSRNIYSDSLIFC